MPTTSASSVPCAPWRRTSSRTARTDARMRPLQRALLWLAVLLLMLAGAITGNADLGAAGAGLALLAFALLAPPPLRPAIAVLLVGALLVRAFGGAALLIDLFPPLVAGLVGWLFARTLAGGRRPL